MKILIVEDEKELAEDIVNYLSQENYQCEIAPDYQKGHEKISNYHYDCILLDLMIPGGDGLMLLNYLKEIGKDSGVIIISAKDSIEDKIEGLKIGADDYLPKPFHHGELAARILSVVRRNQFTGNNNIIQKDIQINIEAKEVSIKGQTVHLTKKEYSLLLFFIGNKNRVLSKGALAEHLSGDYADMFDNHDFVYAHVKNLKKKLKDAGSQDYITTVYGVGYKWEI